MPNIKFNYLYRDGANYKNFGSVIFDNPDGVSLEVIAGDRITYSNEGYRLKSHRTALRVPQCDS